MKIDTIAMKGTDFSRIVTGVGWKHGGINACGGIMFACFVYKNETNNRDVFFTNLTRGPDYRANGISIMELVVMEPCKGDKIQVDVEGTDFFAQSFCHQMRIGLEEDKYLTEQYRRRYREIRLKLE